MRCCHQSYVISSSHLQIHPLALSLSHARAQLVVALLRIQPTSFPLRTSTSTLLHSLSLSHARTQTAHTHKQLVAAQIHIHCNSVSLPPRTYTYTL
mmetsp:Transcript_26389/g.22225  ORF Transcript_26389/g.22225 Transcript_26389/m.22225 type:complete len:96 (-) Transcript_26389:181-468(-)